MPLYALDDLAPQIHASAYIHPAATLIGAVHIGEESSVWPGAVLRADYGAIYIGARTSIQDGSVLHTTSEWPTTVGDECVVGHMVHLEGCVIHDRTLVGSKSAVLNRVVVGQECVIAAGAVVLEDTEIPPSHFAAGIPAKFRTMPKDRSEWHNYAVSSYVDNGKRYRDGLSLIER